MKLNTISKLMCGAGISVLVSTGVGVASADPSSLSSESTDSIAVSEPTASFTQGESLNSVEIYLPDGFTFGSDGRVVTDSAGNTVEVLPGTVSGKDGTPVNLTFERISDREVVVTNPSTPNSLPNQTALRGWWDSWGKCVAGTVGGTGLGGLAGTAVSPIAGTVVGGVSGALTGAAASC